MENYKGEKSRSLPDSDVSTDIKLKKRLKN